MSEEPLSLATAVGRIRTLVDELEETPDPEVRRKVFELLDLVDVLHREGLERIAAGLRSVGLWERAVEDPLVAYLFAIYGLGDPVDPQAAVEEALGEVRDYVWSHGGELELVAIDGGRVRLRMLGACRGCPGSEATLRGVVEEAIRRRWPELVEVVLDEPEERWQPLEIGPRR
ncbi:MAG TPA: NifU family protein [Actinobacteria bacterium]|nr:NifU family protein [Actinomycetota bacterium]